MKDKSFTTVTVNPEEALKGMLVVLLLRAGGVADFGPEDKAILNEGDWCIDCNMVKGKLRVAAKKNKDLPKVQNN